MYPHQVVDLDSEEEEVLKGGVGMRSTTPVGSSQHRKTFWWSGTIKTGGLFRHIFVIPGISEESFYIEKFLTLFGLHCEYEILGSISF